MERVQHVTTMISIEHVSVRRNTLNQYMHQIIVSAFHCTLLKFPTSCDSSGIQHNSSTKIELKNLHTKASHENIQYKRPRYYSRDYRFTCNPPCLQHVLLCKLISLIFFARCRTFRKIRESAQRRFRFYSKGVFIWMLGWPANRDSPRHTIVFYTNARVFRWTNGLACLPRSRLNEATSRLPHPLAGMIILPSFFHL